MRVTPGAGRGAVTEGDKRQKVSLEQKAQRRRFIDGRHEQGKQVWRRTVVDELLRMDEATMDERIARDGEAHPPELRPNRMSNRARSRSPTKT